MRRLLVSLSVLLATGCGGTSTSERVTPAASPSLTAPVGPDGSAFWRVPTSAPEGAKRGDVLWIQARPDAPAGSSGWNLIYVTEGAAGTLVYASGEVYVPNPAPAATPRPLVVWNHGTSGTADSCAPSRNNLVATAGKAGPLVNDADSRVPALMALLARGYTVTMPDYQGLGTPGPTEYLNGPTQGKSALDVVRAMRTLGVASAEAPVAMYGFSQGGQTSLWAAHLAADYAPDVSLQGVVAIAPAARHLALSFYDLGIRANSGYFISRMAGLAVGHPEVQLRQILTPAGLEMLDVQTWDCYEVFRVAAGLDEPYARREALEPGSPWRSLLEANDAFLPIPGAVPIYVLQGDADVDVGVQLTRDVVADLCAGGSTVEYREHAGVNHMDMNTRAAPEMADWFAARFAGQPATSTCRPR